MTTPFTLHCARCGAPMRACLCTGAMLMATPPPEPPKTTIARFKKFGMWSVCDLCGLTLDYCRGHALPEFGTEPTSDLEKRVREAQSKQ